MRIAFILVFFCTLLMGAPSIVVGIRPIAEVVQRVNNGGPWQIMTLLPRQANPETYTPDPRVIRSFRQAKFFISAGTPFEEALAKKLRQSYPELVIVDCRQAVTMRQFPGGGTDPHFWLSFENLRRVAEKITQLLSESDPARKEKYSQNYKQFCGYLQGLHKHLADQLAPLKGREILVHHPAFGYFMEQFGLKQLAVEDEGKEPTGSHLSQIIRHARKIKAPVLFVQPQFHSRSALALAQEIGCPTAILDPLPDGVQGIAAIGTQILKHYLTP